MNKFIKLLLVFTLVLSLFLTFAACDETEDEQVSGEQGTKATTTLNDENGGNGGNGDDVDDGTTGAGGTTESGKLNLDKDNDGGKYGALGTIPR